jgi:hypothetical protein
METTMEFTREIMDALGAPFPEDEIEFLPRATSGGKALGLAYIDARSVMRRLDAVVGPGNWSFDFDVLAPDGKMVKGRLTVLGVTKCDAGEANQEDELLKSAVSDALKRCAVHFGIGRYLYYLPRVWAPFDNQRRQFVEPPRLAPAAVARALEICGISTMRNSGAPSGHGIRNAGSGNPKSAIPNPKSARETLLRENGEAGSAPKSIWAAGTNGTTADEGVKGGTRVADNPAAESSGDRAASRAAEQADTPRTEAPRAESRSPEGAAPAALAPTDQSGRLVCSRPDCGKALTKGQHDVSVRAYGQPLCPACQKQARAAA